MPKKVIAVDIDEVLADWYHGTVGRLNKILGTSVNLKSEEIPFDLHKCFGVSQKRMSEALGKLYEQF